MHGIFLASQAKPSNTYYQIHKFLFAKGRIINAFSGQSAGKGVFCFDRIYRMNSRKPERHWRKIKNKEKGRIVAFLSKDGLSGAHLTEKL